MTDFASYMGITVALILRIMYKRSGLDFAVQAGDRRIEIDEEGFRFMTEYITCGPCE
jgi:hypothetical protein